MIIHCGGAKDEATSIVRELVGAVAGAITPNSSTVNNIVCLVVDEAGGPHPIPRLASPVGICLVAGIKGETGTKREEAGL